MNQPSMQFIYGDREIAMEIRDLLSAPVEVIVSAASRGLSNESGIAARIAEAAGADLQAQCGQLIREHGELESGMAVFTGAGDLSYAAVIHAIGPCMGEGDEQRKLEHAILRCLQLCEMNDWESVAIPAIGGGEFGLPMDLCAQALHRAITRFWDKRHECALRRVLLCLPEEHFQTFFHAFRDDALDIVESEEIVVFAPQDSEPEIGLVELDEQEIASLESDETAAWFK